MRSVECVKCRVWSVECKCIVQSVKCRAVECRE